MDVIQQQQPPAIYQKSTAQPENASEVTKIIYSKGATMSPTNERDAGFCSGGSENEEDLDHHQIRLLNNSSECSSQSVPSSEDSSFVLPTTPVTPVHPAPKNKRKSSEPLRVISEASQCGPIKKRIKLENAKAQALAAAAAAADEEELQKLKEQRMATTTPTPMLSPDPFRPWARMAEESRSPISGYSLSPAHSFKHHPGVTTLHRIPGEEEDLRTQFMVPVQDEPIALIAKKPSTSPEKTPSSPRSTSEGQLAIRNLFLMKHPQQLSQSQSEILREDLHPRPAHLSNMISRTPSLIDETSSTASSFISPSTANSTTLNLSVKAPQMSDSRSPSTKSEKKAARELAREPSQRNYKNMTRERRIEANARERTRVHTISAAFEKLRHSVPAYSNTQKLSKLSVLRIACSYIMSLSRIAGMDYSEDQSEPPIGDCVDALTKTIQTEGKLRKKKDE